VQARLRQDGGDAVLTLDAETTLTFADPSAASLSADDFPFV